MLFKKRFNKRLALEVITEAILFSQDIQYIRGLCAMAQELGLISKNEAADLVAAAEKNIHN